MPRTNRQPMVDTTTTTTQSAHATTAEVIELVTPSVDTTPSVGHNSLPSLSDILNDIAKLRDDAASFTLRVDDIARNATQHIALHGDGTAIAKLYDALSYFGKRGLQSKLKAWIEHVVHYRIDAGDAGAPSACRKAKKREETIIHDQEAFDVGPCTWSAPSPEKEDWDLLKHIQKAFKRLVKEGMSEVDAAQAVLKAAELCNAKTVDVPVTDTATPANTGHATPTEQAD